MMTEKSESLDLHKELDAVNDLIMKHTAALDVVTGDLQVIENQLQCDDMSREVFEIQEKLNGGIANIPADEALEVVTRLQNGLKVVKRRNQLLERENATQERLLKERSKLLLKETKNYDEILSLTGWHEQSKLDHDDVKQKMDEIQEMLSLEKTVRRELHDAQSTINKKEAVIRNLEAQCERGRDADALLNNLYNEIRVKERDCHELELQLRRMRKQDEKNEEALVAYGSQKETVSVIYMKNDINYIKEALSEIKAVSRRQDLILKAQLARQHQLQNRLDTILNSLQEMKLDKEYKRNLLKSAIVPSDSREEPTDVSAVIPENEYIPIHIYRLVHKNNEMMQASLVRKNVLVLEKEGVIQAMETSLLKYGNALLMADSQRGELRQNRDLEMGELIDELRNQHQNFLQQLEKLGSENNHLKKKIYNSTRKELRVKSHQVV